LRDDERKPEATSPPVGRPAAVRVQPTTTDATVRAEEVRSAIRILDGFVHCNDPPKTHGLNLLVRELLTDQAGDFGVGLGQVAAVGLGTNLLRGAVVVLEEHALENGDFGGHAGSRLEVRRAEHALGVVAQTETLLFQTPDPFLAGRAVRSDAEVDYPILFPPGASRFGNRQLAAEEPFGSVFTGLLLEQFNDCVQLAGGVAGGCEFRVHDCLLALICAFSFSSNPRRNHGPCGHSQEMPKNQHLLAMTTLASNISKNCLYYTTLKFFVNLEILFPRYP